MTLLLSLESRILQCRSTLVPGTLRYRDVVYIVRRAEFRRRQRSILRSGRGGNTVEGIGDCKRIQLVGDCRLRRGGIWPQNLLSTRLEDRRGGLSFQFHSTNLLFEHFPQNMVSYNNIVVYCESHLRTFCRQIHHQNDRIEGSSLAMPGFQNSLLPKPLNCE